MNFGGLLLPMVVSGCMLPLYQQPQGFSSTYHRHLQQTSQAQAAAGPPSGSISAVNGTTSAVSNATPDRSSRSDKDAAAAERPESGWWTWIQRPFTFGQKPESKADDDDEESTAARPERSARQ